MAHRPDRPAQAADPGRPALSSDALVALAAVLQEEIPLVGHLGISIVGEVDGGLRLRAPLAGNVNHEGTAFAGSLNAVATLAGWGTVWLALHRAGLPGAVVIQDSATRYRAPVQRDFVATAAGPGADALGRLLAQVRRHGRGRIPLRVELAEEGGRQPALEFSGRYVVVPASRTR